MRSSFASFNTGLLGMRASQYALDITGHNVVNIGTKGYTRQRIDQYSMSLNGSGSWETKVGHGVMVSGVSQIRDPYLDVRFRDEIAQVGYSDSTLQGLRDLESIINEVGSDTGIIAQFDELSKAMAKLASEPKNVEYQNIVRSTTDSLTKFMNQYAKKIDIAKSETETNFMDTTVPEVNALLKSIKDLNVSIETNQINGNPSLELLDQRNMFIDQLAQHIKIDVKYKSVNIPGTERTYQQLNITYMDNTGGNGSTLIKGRENPAEFKAAKTTADADGNYNIELTLIPGGNPTPAETADLFPTMDECAFKGTMELLNCEGLFNTANPGESRGYGYYTKMMNTLAVTMATTFNKANEEMTDAKGNKIGGDMFAANDGSGKITAKNICIADGWANGSYGLIANRDPANTNSADNLLYMETLLTSAKTDFPKVPGGDVAFSGTFSNCFSNMHGMLGVDIKTTDAILNNHLTVAGDISDNIDSVSSVHLDEEGVNMMHYQKSLNAAIRFMTTMDEALNTVINNMGIVGR